MTGQALLDNLSSIGVRFRANGDKLVFDAPPGVVTESVAGTIRRAKPVLLRLLATRKSSPAGRFEDLLAAIADAEAREELRFEFEERSAVFEYEGGMTREAAEGAALEHLRADGREASCRA